MAELELATEKIIEANQARQVFPLPLGPFEKFVLWDETWNQPMNSFIELHFDSDLDCYLLEESLNAAVHRNPLLACRVADHSRGLFWEYDPEYRPRLRLESEDPPLQSGWPVPIDLRTECGSRYWYRQYPGGSRLLIQLHHACTDGVGLRRVLIDALTSYANSTRPRMDGESGDMATNRSLRQPDAASLRNRFNFSETFAGPPVKRLTTWQRLKNAHYFHFQSPTPLVGKPSDQDELEKLDPHEPLRHCVLERDQSTEIMDTARRRGLGINDLALALLFEACARWNAGHGQQRPGSRIRLLMPYDLRSRVDLRMPASNRLSFSFLGRTQAKCQDKQSLIESVQRETKDIKETRLPLDFLNGLELACQYPRLMKWLLGRSHHMATAVLTYTGDVLRGTKKHFPEEEHARRIGNVGLKNIMVAPPTRRNTNISLGLCINWGQLCLSAAWNRQSFSADDCEQFLALYRTSWLEWLDENQKLVH